MDSASNTFAVKMTKWNLQHNHSLTEYGFRQHPSNRMRSMKKRCRPGTNFPGRSPDNSESNPTLQDVHNLVRKLKLRDDDRSQQQRKTLQKVDDGVWRTA
ncbi:hypothetical protein GQ600_26404 [Phytophthora cactorum]|nr:hypothetical protein GQ600_26404 [Phytophthora cactorum]